MNSDLIPEYLQKYYKLLSNFVTNASKSWLYSTSFFFSKVGVYDAYRNYRRIGYFFKIKQILRYYAFSYLALFKFAINKLIFFLSSVKISINADKLVIIDTYAIVDNLVKGTKLASDYFPNLVETLKVRGLDYVIIPRFYGSNNPFSFWKVIKILKEYEGRVVTEFQLLSSLDLLKLFFYITVYPFLMLNLLRKVRLSEEALDSKLVYYFWSDLNGSNFFGTVRYLFGLKLAKIIPPNSKVIQWYEGQPYEKCLNRAFRYSKLEVKIYGTQFFIFPPELLNSFIDSNEFREHLPDIILVNGTHYLDKNTEMRVGPSMRYSRLFKTEILESKSEKILILLSYFHESNIFILKLLQQLGAYSEEIFSIKMHPSTNISEIKEFLPKNYQIVYDNIYDLFSNHGLVLGVSTGAQVEAIACGLPVIVISENGKSSYSYLPDFCKGVLWEDAYDLDSFESAKNKLFNVVRDKQEQRLNMIRRVRNEMFTEPTNERIVEAFELN
ncbi:hypothetical protein CH354_16045 [Leptospira levettii]|uniref:hypothetical protein n=1 Tax=Leptospira levettii TaxID=2023178 RepID=UPI000C298671|nr:hypothetical protein [Leptospira levettii]MCW7472041.1 hypothetical protein [Leptospira levettii]PJZ36171.1 hypothetical protein CH354_16045 [Leptospira levettii]PJZ90157.1 hypothetical protein CH368_03065 [Leptospira levettii]PJZ99857.1 hypothetical protein CH369_12195 [Leptospira levettii]